MAAADELEKFHCVCGALALRANRTGIEVYCDQCKRRWVVPFEDLEDRESLFRFWETWRAEQKRT